MNLFQKIVSLLDFVFILYDFLTAEKKTAEISAAAEIVPAKENSLVKTEIDERIKSLRDLYFFEFTRSFKTVKGYTFKSRDALLMDWVQEAVYGRLMLERETGARLPSVQMHSVIMTNGRADCVSCTLDFTDENESTVCAKPRPEDLAKLADLDKRMKRFLN